MKRPTLREEDPDAWLALAVLEAAGSGQGYIQAAILADLLGWQRGKIRSTIDRLDAQGFLSIDTKGHRCRVKIISEGAETSLDKLRAVQARQDRVRPLRFAEGRLYLSSGTFRDLPKALIRPEFYDMWKQFAVLCDQRLEDEGLPFRPELFFKELLKIAEGLQDGQNSHNKYYVYLICA